MPNTRGARWAGWGGFWREACARSVSRRNGVKPCQAPTNIRYRGGLAGGASEGDASGVLVVLGGVVLGSPALPPGVVAVSPAPVVAVSGLADWLLVFD